MLDALVPGRRPPRRRVSCGPRCSATESAKDPATKGGDEPGDGSKSYGNVEYADNGRQADGKKRYPIDTELI